MAILVQIFLFDFEKLSAAIQQFFYPAEAGVQFVRMRDILKAQFEQLGLRITKHLAEKSIYLKESASGRDQRHSMGRKTKCGTEPRFVDSQRFFRAFEFAFLQAGG